MNSAETDAGVRGRIRALVAAAERQAGQITPESRSSDLETRADASASQIQDVESLLGRDLPGYRILGEIRRGGQGVIFRAVQLSTRRHVALKVLRDGPFAAAADRLRFEREVQVLAQLRHPDIVTIHDSGQAAGHFYLVTDWIDGQALDAYVMERGRDVRETLRLFVRICDAVNAAHLRGVTHRDLKPGNILVDAGGAPHILDFGLAKISSQSPSSSLQSPVSSSQSPKAGSQPLVSSSQSAVESGGSSDPGSGNWQLETGDYTQTGQFVGSMPWCSPEQAGGCDIDIRTDVYSLGVTLYQMLTGQFPYRVTGPPELVLASVRRDEPIRPRSARRVLDDEVETILLKCLQKEPVRRYQSAGELGRDLVRYLGGEPIEAKRDSAAYLLRKALRRHWVGSSIAAGFLLLMAIALPTFYTLWQNADQQRTRAQAAEAKERDARGAAEHEASKARSVTRFLRDMLSSADPTNAQGRAIDIRDVLASAQRELDNGSFAAEPDVAAAVRATLGRTYLSISRLEEAGTQLEQAIAQIEQISGPTSTELIEPLIDLGRVRRGQGRGQEAESLPRRALQIAEANYGPNDVELAAPLSAVATTIFTEGQLGEPTALLERRLNILRAALGDDHPDVALATADLAQTLHDPARAEKLLEHAAEIARRSLAPNHPKFARIFRAQANAALMRGDYSASEAAFLEALRLSRTVFGPESGEVYSVLADLAMLYEFSKRPDQQIATLNESIRVGAVMYGKDSVEVVRRKLDLCTALGQSGCVDEAERTAREGVESLLRSDKPDIRLCTILRHSLAILALRRNDLETAEDLAHQILAVERSDLAPFTWPHQAAKAVLGGVHLARNEYELAEQQLLEAIQNTPREGYLIGHRKAMIEKLIQVYERWGRPQQAESWRAEIDEPASK
jgi:serine/threonine protein kinase/tetratricopeptide (TPR) repeat protein